MSVHASEKRGFLRVPFNTEVEVRVQDRIIRSRDDINISMGGIRLSIAEPVPAAGSACTVKVILGEGEERIVIRANGRSIGCKSGILAVEFIDLDIDSYAHLKQLIVNNADDPERAEAEFAAHWGIRTPQQ